MITNESNPSLYPSLHEAMWYVVSSDNSSEASFKYVFDVYVGGNLVSRTKAFPHPSSMYGVMDVAPIVRAFITNYFKPSSTFFSWATNDIAVDYEVKFGEEYISGGNLVTNLNLTTISAKGYNFYSPLFADSLLANTYNPLVLSSYQDGLLIENFGDDILTERDMEVKLELNDPLFVSYLKIAGGSYTAQVEIINEAGQVISQAGGSISLDTLNVFNLQPAFVNEWYGDDIITESTYGYNFFIRKDGADSRKVKVRLVCNPKNRQYNLHFLNRLGGFDTMRFGLVNKRTQKVERKQYVKSPYELSGNTMKKYDEYNKMNETKVNFAINHTNTYHLISDWVSETDYDWLAQLVASPLVYFEFNGAYFPVTITNDTHEQKKEGSDKLFNFELDIEVNNLITSQFR